MGTTRPKLGSIYSRMGSLFFLVPYPTVQRPWDYLPEKLLLTAGQSYSQDYSQSSPHWHASCWAVGNVQTALSIMHSALFECGFHSLSKYLFAR